MGEARRNSSDRRIGPSRLDLTPVVDVLILVFFAFVTQATLDSHARTDEHAEAILELMERMEGLLDIPRTAEGSGLPDEDIEARLEETWRLLGQWQELVSSMRADLDNARRALADQTLRAERAEESLEDSLEAAAERERIMLESLSQSEIYRDLAPSAQQALQDLLTTTITVLELYIADDRVVAYQRVPNGPRTELSQPVELTRLAMDQEVANPLDYEHIYLGNLFGRLERALDNTLSQTSHRDQVYYLMVNEEGNSCAALVGLDREIYEARELLVVPPRHACP